MNPAWRLSKSRQSRAGGSAQSFVQVLRQINPQLGQQRIVKTRRESQTIYYSLADGPAEKVIHLLHETYCGTDLAGNKEAD